MKTRLSSDIDINEIKSEITKTVSHGRAYNFFRKLFGIRDDMMDNAEIQQMMEDNTVISGSNMWILIMAIFIASIGLNVNSTAVIIGAMLISPLMSGILTMGYSLATFDLTLLRKAFTRFGIQVIISLIASTLYFAISPLTVATSEMIARTSPTLWDVLIALFGGIAGGIGNTRKKKSNVIPGVAIATALMPPLCTTGYGLATGQLRFIAGAFYLFVINTLFIMLSAAFITKLMRIPTHIINDTKKERRIHRFVILITILTIVPSVLIGAYKVYETVMKQNLSSYLDDSFTFNDTKVVQSQIDVMNREVSLSLVGTQLSDDVISVLEKDLSNYGLENYKLNITQNKTVTADNSDQITIALQEQTIESLQKQLDEQEKDLKEQQKKLDEMKSTAASQPDMKKLSEKAAAIFTEISDISCGIMTDSDGEYILLCGTAKKALSADKQQTVKNWLVTETGVSRATINITARQ